VVRTRPLVFGPCTEHTRATFAPWRSDPTGADAAVGAERIVSLAVPEETVPGSDAAAAADVEPSAENATVATAASPNAVRRMTTTNAGPGRLPAVSFTAWATPVAVGVRRDCGGELQQGA
jgi:hypothetical protein